MSNLRNTRYWRLRTTDWILIAFLLLTGLLLFTWLKLHADPGAMAVVLADGEKIAEFPMNQDTEYLIEAYPGETNKLVIYDGMAFFEEANCPDRLCVLQGSVSKNLESIVCLPHGVIVEIHGGE